MEPTVKHAAMRTRALNARKGINWTVTSVQVRPYLEVCLVKFPNVIKQNVKLHNIFRTNL